ncbi:MAG: hypothetical protein V3V35_06270 [Dehalococcoidia bacterium]
MLIRLAPLVVLALLLAACGGDGDGGSTAPGPSDGTPDRITTPGSDEAAALATFLATVGASGTVLTATPGEERPPEVAASEDLARRLKTSVDEIELVSVEPMEWPDACLGLGEENEVCAEVITAGFEVVLKVGDSQFTYHTNETGTHARFADVDISSD